MSIINEVSLKKIIPVEQAVGMVLPHDITEIVKDKVKGRAFRKGHIVRQEDLDHLRRLGKDHIYVLQLAKNEIHENEAALLLARGLTGLGTEYQEEIVEGKVSILASMDGLLKINQEALLKFNMLGDIMCATLQTNTQVRKGEEIAASRLIPLVANRQIINRAMAIAYSARPLIQVLPLRQVKAGLVVTGNEVYHGRIEDKFEGVLRDKLSSLGSTVNYVGFAPDDPQKIAEQIHHALAAGAQLVVTSGGMSVDPDDVTRQGITVAGAEDILYGTPVLPGAMFLVGRLGKVPVVGLPACGMFHKITVFDLVVPRILAGDTLKRQDLAKLGHGGLCRHCKHCQYPACSFGK